jgi:excisionase family DNA binding protein
MSTEPQLTGRMIVPGMTVLLSASDVALFLGISTKTIHKLVRDQKLASAQVTGRDRRFPRKDSGGFRQKKRFPSLGLAA